MPHKTAEARAAYQKQYRLDHPDLFEKSQEKYRAAGKKRATEGGVE